ncbi:uncharacterized protein LOC121915584 [Sceloporus undulatus]|uniref:uncharacterized protein LOC121915584 n=1 Tax=Sceloporus undulatus TaxID=8520 RepID=UPI001C4B7E51|nr:uncharacterized protein LOC121915584 [Sceloporus undulatus]
MAAIRGLWLLGLLLLASSPRSEDSPLEQPCGQHLRQRDGVLELGSNWLATAATLSSIWAMFLLAMYALHCVCAKKMLCGCNAEEERHTQRDISGGQGLPTPSLEVKKGSQETEERGVAAGPSSSQARPCAVPQSGRHLPSNTKDRRAYAQKLASMSQALESLMCDVRTQQRSLGDISLAEPAGQKKLNITVYEIADQGMAAGLERQQGPRSEGHKGTAEVQGLRRSSRIRGNQVGN